MNYYETLYIVHPALESGRLKDIILSTQSMFEGMNIEVLNTDIWGKKKLAYLIDKQQYGTYVLVQLKSNGQDINKISTELEHNPNILAYLTNRITESEIQKNPRTLDEQILGSKSSESGAVKDSDSATRSNTTKVLEKNKPAEASSSSEAVEGDKPAEASSSSEAVESDNNNEELRNEENNGTNE